MPVTPIRILIADDHPVVRLGIRNLLQAEPGFTVLGEATEGKDAVGMTRSLKPDVLLLDLAMPNLSGVEVLRELGDEHRSTQVLLLTAGADREQIVEAFRLGARGVLLKDSAPQEVVSAIHKVSSGQYWVAPEAAADLVNALQQPDEEKPQKQRFGLTPRELEVIKAIVDGCSNKDIARSLSISEDTVKRHLTNIFDKVGVSTRLELGLFAISHRLVPQGE